MAQCSGGSCTLLFPSTQVSTVLLSAVLLRRAWAMMIYC